MRTNSTGLRLNYSSSWSNKIAPGRSYTDNFVTVKQNISSYLSNFFSNLNVSKNILSSKYKVYFISKNIILINIYVYIFKYNELISVFKRKHTSTFMFFNKFLINACVKPYIKKINYIILTDFSKIFKNKFFYINFILIKKKYFDASVASKYITSKLLNKFKLNKVVSDLTKDIVLDKNKNGIIVYCSGRFDRKERASSSIFSKGKISLTTVKNKVTYSQNNVILKYGICGVKVWVLN